MTDKYCPPEDSFLELVKDTSEVKTNVHGILSRLDAGDDRFTSIDSRLGGIEKGMADLGRRMEKGIGGIVFTGFVWLGYVFFGKGKLIVLIKKAFD